MTEPARHQVGVVPVTVLIFDGGWRSSLRDQGRWRVRVGGFSAALRARGHRLTVQRGIILDIVESISGHISVDDVFQQVHARFPEVNVSTIYRTMELLEEEGLVTHIHFHDGVAKWHRAEESQHQHLVCQRCGAEQELALEVTAPWVVELQHRYGFLADLAHFAIIGICRACQARGA